MQLEFIEAYEQLFLQSYKRLEGALKHKIDSIQKCEDFDPTKSHLKKKQTFRTASKDKKCCRFGIK